MKKMKMGLMVFMSVVTVWLTSVIAMDVRAAETTGVKEESVKVIEVFAKNEFNKNICDDKSYSAEQKELAGCNEARTAGGVGIALVNIVLSLVGIVAVVMIIVGGVTYTTSAGDAGKIKKAKDTIMYGVIGMVIALLAFAIVNFVLTSVFGS